jgi:hypothetical protein
MSRTATGWDGVRALRPAAFAVAATCLALGSHVLAGGGVPALAPTLLACLLPGAAGALLTRRRRGPLEILVVLGAVQLTMHEVFAAAGVSPARTGSGAAMPADCPMASMGSMSVGSGDAGSGGAWLMLGAHLGATVATAVLLAWGEHVLHTLVQVLAQVRRGSRWTVSVAAPRPVAARPLRPVSVTPSVPRLGLVAVAGVARRGPPLPA